MRKLLLLISILFFVSCVPKSTISLLTREEADVAPTGEKLAPFDTTYGAHYLVDELYMQVDFGSLGPSTKMIYNKILRIDDQRGLEYATFSLPNSSSSSAFSFRMWDSTGMEVPLDHAKMRQDFYDNGKVAFPQVTPGCDLQVKIEYTDATIYPFYEHWFSSNLPVSRSRFTLSVVNTLHYKEKLYGPTTTIMRDRKLGDSRGFSNRSFVSDVWEVKNFSPLSQTKYESTPDLDIPRVSVVLRSSTVGGVAEYFFDNWGEICKGYREELLNKQRFTSSRKMLKKAEELTVNVNGDREKAEAIFNWVRDSIRLEHSPRKLINPSDVMIQKRGNTWDITYVMKEMLTHVGVEADVVVTRTRDNGGFDPDFITPAPMSVPLVTLKAGSERLLAFPYYKGTALGEYPLTFFSLKGVSLEKGYVVTLPEPKSRTSLITTETVIDLADEEKPFSGRMVIDGYLAYSMRTTFINFNEEQQRESIQKLLSSYDDYNALIDGSIENINQYGEPITITFAFKNSENRIPRKGKTYMQLSPFFEDFLTAVSVDRKHPLYIEHGYTQKERVLLKNSDSVAMANEVRNESVESLLFSLKTAIAQEANDLAIERVTTIKAGSVQPADLKAMEQKFKRLNSLKSESVIY